MLLNAELSLQLPKLNRYFNFLGVDPLSVYSEGIALCHLKGYNQLLSLLCLVVCCLLFWRGLFHSDSVPPIIFLNNFFRKCFLCSRQVLNSLCRMTFDLAALSSHALGLYSHILLCPTGAEHRASFMLSELHPILSSVLGMAGAGWGVWVHWWAWGQGRSPVPPGPLADSTKSFPLPQGLVSWRPQWKCKLMYDALLREYGKIETICRRLLRACTLLDP